MPLGFLLGDVVVEASSHEFNILKNDIKSIGNKTNIHISPGNHDVGTGPYNAKRDIYIQNFGETFKYFKYENDLFILLDANLNNWNIIDDQLQMLKSLNSGKNEYDNVFIFSHQVIWVDDESKNLSSLIVNSKEGKAEKLNFWNDVFPVIEDIGERVFLFAGDVGAFDNKSEFFYDNIQGVDFFATGMGGGKRDNFLFVHVNHDKVNVELVQL
jgi:3',5'-cyclic AMP phosphodiesterase CpdA